jgi:hypothetical protein
MQENNSVSNLDMKVGIGDETQDMMVGIGDETRI